MIAAVRQTIALIALTLFLLALLLAAAAAAEPRWDWTAPAPHHAAACRVIAPNGSAGSGGYVEFGGMRGVLTCAHVLPPDGRLTAVWPDGQRLAGVATRCRYGADVAWLPVEHPTAEPLRFASVEPRPGDTAELLGFGGPDTRLRHFRCTVLRHRYQGVLCTDGNITHGDSGGMVLNAEHEVIGVNSWGDQPIAHVRGFPVYAISGSAEYASIKSFLSRVRGQLFGDRAQSPADPGCVGGNCPAPRGGGRGGADLYPPPGNGVPYEEPSPEIASPSPRPTPEPAPVPEIDYERIAAAVLARLRADEAFRGPPGPAGEDGRSPVIDYEELLTLMAADGRFQGPAGRDGAAAAVDLPRLAEEVIGQLPPVHVQVLDDEGTVRQEQFRRLGEPIRFQLVPTR